MFISFKDREAELLGAFEALGKGWHSRQEIADHLGKNKLSPADTTLLDAMVDKGLIEKSMAQTALVTVNRWQYRVKG